MTSTYLINLAIMNARLAKIKELGIAEIKEHIMEKVIKCLDDGCYTLDWYVCCSSNLTGDDMRSIESDFESAQLHMYNLDGYTYLVQIEIRDYKLLPEETPEETPSS